jgi:hypothetical protein
MKQFAYIILSIFILFSSCQNKKEEVISGKTLEERQKVDSVVNEMFGESSNDLNYLEFDEKKVDTLLELNNKGILQIKLCDSLLIQDYIEDDKILKAISNQFSNSQESALAIENYLFKTNRGIFKRDSIGLKLKLENGNWIRVSVNDSTYDEVDNTFEYYFKEYGFYSVRTQCGEGNGFKIINSKTGKEIRINGRPYFSKNGRFLIAVNCDIEAGYSANGFQLFENLNGNLMELIEFDPQNWGSLSAKWLNDSTVILKNETFQKQFYTRLTLKKSN